MSKYIVEIKPEYEDSFKGLMILGAKDSNLFVDTLAVDDLEQLNSDYINEHYGQLQDDAYQKGVEDGRNETWEAAKKIEFGISNGGITTDVMMEIFGTYIPNKVLRKFTAAEAIAKLKAYEEKQKAEDEIKVGDEMRQVYESGVETGVRCIVTAIDSDCMSGFSQDGRAIVCSSQVNRWWKKTGRRFDIDKILKEMRG